VVAAEDDRESSSFCGLADAARDAGGDLLDLGEEARSRIALVGRLGDCDLDVPEIVYEQSESGQALVEAGVADRGGPHVDAAASCAEVESGPDDGDAPVGHAGRRLFWNPQHRAAR
jgi:hypothetical protein